MKRFSVPRSRELKISAIISRLSVWLVADRFAMNSVRKVISISSSTLRYTDSMRSIRITTSMAKLSGKAPSKREA